MRKTILEKLEEIEKRENVKILYCVEAGSRAWGFASPDSDYDVRFIYARPKEYYLRLDKDRDVIEWQLDDTLDINGWDVQKALALAYKSNPSLFEWKASPIVYKTTDDWDKISAVMDKYFDVKSGLYHYLNVAKGNFREYLKGETVRLKKYFYVIRPLLACEWILKEGTPPPIELEVLAEKYLDDSIKPEVDKLLYMKVNTPEITEGKSINPLNEYLKQKIAEIEEVLSTLPTPPAPSWNELNNLFLQILN